MAGTGCPTNTNIRHTVPPSALGSHVKMKLSIFLLACCVRRLDRFGCLFFFSISILAYEKVNEARCDLPNWWCSLDAWLRVRVRFFGWRLLLRIFSAVLFNAYSPLLFELSVQRNV